MLSVDRERALDAWLGPPLCWLLSVWHLLVGGRPARPEVGRILVIALSEMGALVLARPMFASLRTRYPDARIHVLCFAQNRDALDVLDAVPRDQVIGLRTDSVRVFLGDCVRAIRVLRAMSIDVVLDLELFARASAIISALSGAPIRVGFHRHTQEGLYRGSFLTRPVLYNPYRHISDQFVTLAEAIDSSTTPPAKRLSVVRAAPPPPFELRAGEVDEARERLRARYGSRVATRPLVLVGPGAGLLPVRAWPLEHYITVARSLAEQGAAIGVIGLPVDGPLARAIEAACPPESCVDLTGHTRSVRELVALLHLGRLLITNDGGTGHFASLTTIPTIILYGPETPTLYGNVSPHAVNLYKPIACSPCLTAYNHRRTPCDGDNVCLKSIAPAEVLAEAHRLLRLGASVPTV